MAEKQTPEQHNKEDYIAPNDSKIENWKLKAAPAKIDSSIRAYGLPERN